MTHLSLLLYALILEAGKKFVNKDFRDIFFFTAGRSAAQLNRQDFTGLSVSLSSVKPITDYIKGAILGHDKRTDHGDSSIRKIKQNMSWLLPGDSAGRTIQWTQEYAFKARIRIRPFFLIAEVDDGALQYLVSPAGWSPRHIANLIHAQIRVSTVTFPASSDF
jgi:hypothetical protein